jgi:two-component system cell cycle response regulator
VAEERLILVVDDEPDILSLHRVILGGEGWQVITSGDGVDAIQKAIDRLPDLIVLDVMMPRMNGYQVCRLLKNDPRTAAIPIVICTVHSLESERRYALTSGADEYLVKPFDPADLLRLVRRLLAGRPAQTGRHRGSAAPRHPTSTDSILSDVNRLLDRRLMQLTILQHLAAAMAGTLHLDGVLGIVLQSIVTDLGYPGGMIFLAGEGGRLEERIAQREPLVLEPERHPVFGSALAENRVVVLHGEALLRDAPPEFQSRIGASTAILVPIQAKSKPIGLLVVESSSPAVERDQLDFLQTIANQSGLAIENANLYARTLQLSITDELTGLHNYRHFCERLESEIARARRYRLPLGLLLIDIDRFKTFNDRFGHLLGDEVLKAVARCLRANSRDVDLVARYGGEEFCIILQEVGEGIRAHAERICEAVARVRVPAGGGSEGVTVSIGAAVSGDGEPGARELIRRADAALYRAKERGRNRVSVWDDQGAAGDAAPHAGGP